MENNTTNDKHIHGDVQDPNVTEATTPLDDASCCASLFLSDFADCVPKYPWPVGYVPRCAPQDFDVWEELMWSNTINSLFVKEGENLCGSI
jgi:hypothetical protein